MLKFCVFKSILYFLYFCCSDHYFTSVSWISLTEIAVVWLNRPQNLSIVTICSSPKWECREVCSFHYSYRPSLKPEIVCGLIFYETKFRPTYPVKAVCICNSKRKCLFAHDENFSGLLRSRLLCYNCNLDGQ